MESVTDVVEEFTVVAVPLTVKLPVIVAFPSTDKSDAVSKPKSVKNFFCVAMKYPIFYSVLFYLWFFGVKKRGSEDPLKII
tara:strand:- start:3757 stop:3999 length:243 start_codon:yes stop_codon:yes gene_type:complete